MWWRDVISTHSDERSDNSHYAIPVWATSTARTGTPWIWKYPTCDLTQKNISPDAAGVESAAVGRGRNRCPAASWCCLRSCADATKHVGPKVFPAVMQSEKYREGSGTSEGQNRTAWKARFLLFFRPLSWRLPLIFLSCIHVSQWQNAPW